MAGKGFEINKRGIAKMAKEIEREFAKHPIRVPVEADSDGIATLGTTVNNYNGPIFQGSADGAQIAWQNNTVSQSQSRTEQIAPGFELVAQAVVRTLEGLPVAGLSEADTETAEEAGKTVLEEVVKDAPNRGRVRMALAAMKGILLPLAHRAGDGVGDGVSEWAKTAVDQLSAHF